MRAWSVGFVEMCVTAKPPHIIIGCVSKGLFTRR